ncbi:TetR/AcrR family transcriptional regulator [Pseudoteredinibacter isoporae]|uniref:TetR/AcrR family transcriptional repressor of nem operon n=1 Tax=Pseudoteredinibacter isoporae TaxID=570281 RepID=A0A7X0JUD9_9GAMM|nr:TetR/AcrR family transcriptional regulator [Pseudoteredinibacter isoporae]MBB6522414.1 TetR/AcrR family transcriptional repressor of nem operon [Pseudoteredinibacter isoporae]NHO87946.1 TetR/AcrR family transcriptional regulator [Pseudoteredinibacter isoporae]NIB23723.1 TetR/AcrR family transcriptional regulator [Pseudoteredinibacter isoporae]
MTPDISQPKQVRKKNRKQEIIQISLELLQTQGYENFSYQDISSALGITKASIHYHFPKKEDLGLALCGAIKQWHEDLFLNLRDSDHSAKDKLRIFVEALLSYAEGPYKVCPLSSLQADVAKLPDTLLPALQDLDRHELDFVSQVLEEGRQNGEFHFPGDAQAQASIFVLSLKGALQYSRIHGGEWISPVLQQLDQLLQASST